MTAWSRARKSTCHQWQHLTQFNPPPQVIPQVISPNFPLPSPMKCHGEFTGNCDFFKQQWRDYETATGLDKREESVRLATLRTLIGRECLHSSAYPRIPKLNLRRFNST